MSYFWPCGRCKHCGWGSHLREDFPARKKGWFRKARAARSIVRCFNCGLVTELPLDEGNE